MSEMETILGYRLPFADQKAISRGAERGVTTETMPSRRALQKVQGRALAWAPGDRARYACAIWPDRQDGRSRCPPAVPRTDAWLVLLRLGPFDQHAHLRPGVSGARNRALRCEAADAQNGRRAVQLFPPVR